MQDSSLTVSSKSKCKKKKKYVHWEDTTVTSRKSQVEEELAKIFTTNKQAKNNLPMIVFLLVTFVKSLDYLVTC
jgi:hypothetical protein